MEKNNLAIYSRFMEVPDNAKKRITGGKLNGMTDINPIWRIRCLTELFGPCGLGWYTKTVERWTDTAEGETAAWVKIDLYVKWPETNEWSMPIEGLGGSKLCGKGMGSGINDEAFKMAETDALSVACKKLGIGAKVYWDKDNTKYIHPDKVDEQPAQESRQQKQNMSAPSAPMQTPPSEDGGLAALALDDALQEVKDAKTAEELNMAWSKWKSAFGKNPKFVNAVAKHPANPGNGRSNGKA